jgi:hypothetical protein
MRRFLCSRRLLVSVMSALVVGCSAPPETASKTAGPVPPDARQIAREAFVYGFPA